MVLLGELLQLLGNDWLGAGWGKEEWLIFVRLFKLEGEWFLDNYVRMTVFEYID